jgi:hypothetical protein
MVPKFVAHARPVLHLPSRPFTRNCMAVLIFACMFSPLALATGAGKSNVPCQGTVISPTDDIVSIINGGQPNQIFCIEGEHRIASSIQLQSGQSLIGTTANSRISGATILSPWQSTSTQGVYYYDGPYAQTEPHQQNQIHAGGENVCYWVSTYQDDLFFRTNSTDDERVMRVLSEAEVSSTQPVTTPGQAVTAGEAGRFFFDYANHRIYLSLPKNQNPNDVTVDLAINLDGQKSNTLLYGPGQSNVTLQNLTIEKGMNYGLFGGNSWTLKDMTIRFIHNVGLYNIFGSIGHPAVIEDTLFTNNGRTGLNAASTINLTLRDSEMSWNNIANFRATTGQTGSGVCQGYDDAGAFHIYHDVGTQSQLAVIVNNLWSHDNIGDGLWSDGGTQYTQITNSIFDGNERYGYLHEISCQVLFSNNTIYGNGYPLKNLDIPGGGVDVSNSNYGTFRSNLLYGNDGPSAYAFHLTLQSLHDDMDINTCLGAGSGEDVSNTLKNNQVLNNAIYSCSGEAAIGKVWGPGGTLNSRGNQYQSNSYHLADSTSNWFSDGDNAGNYVPQDWGTWQQMGHDVEGTLTVGCYSPAGGEVGTLTTLNLTPASVNAKAAEPVLATATVKPTLGGGIPTGTVSFSNGTTQIGKATLSSGTAIFSYNPSALGTANYSITATYLQNSNFGSSTSASQTLRVQDFKIAASPKTVTVSAPGQSGATTLTLTPLNGFSQILAYNCVGLPSGATCTFTPASATTETLSIRTTAPSARLHRGPANGWSGFIYAFLLPGFLGLAVSRPNRNSCSQSGRFLGVIALLTIAILAMLGCSGLSKASYAPPTPTGNSLVTVEAATSGTSSLSHTVMVTLAVQ